MKRSRRLRFHSRVNPVLIALLLAWSADGAFADPSSAPSASGDAGSSSTPYLILGAVAAGFLATYALLLGGNDRSHSKSALTATGDTPMGVPPQHPGTPGETEPPVGTETLPDPLADPEGPMVPGVSSFSEPIAEAPEPGTLLLLGSGAAAILAVRLRRRPR